MVGRRGSIVLVHCRGVESSLVAAGGAITLAGGVVAGVAGGGVVAGAGGGIVTAAVIVVVVSLVAAFEGVKQALEREAGQFKSTSTLVVVSIIVGPNFIF